MDLPELLTGCKCGREHKIIRAEVYCEQGAIKKLPDIVKSFGCGKVFLTADVNTFKVAGKRALSILDNAGIPYTYYGFDGVPMKPDEKACGSLFMHFDNSCDCIVGVGGGVINDLCKMLSVRTGKKYIIIATAPSMDGYLSATSSMEMDGLKVSLNTRMADAVIGDIDILREAPEISLISGLGDMLAKYVSICDWRISNLINGEYYCENVASLVRKSLQKCVNNRYGLLKREPEAVKAVFEGLLLAGAAMYYAGASRPASGAEHYISHVWDMRALEFGTPSSTHGVQCAVGTFYCIKAYNELKNYTPDKAKAFGKCESFEYDNRAAELKKFLGKASDTMISLEKREGKYDKVKQKERFGVIAEKWNEILKIIDEEIPSDVEIEGILDSIHAPETCDEIGLEKKIMYDTFRATKDIRDKYVLSRLLFDLGIEEEFAVKMTKW